MPQKMHPVENFRVLNVQYARRDQAWPLHESGDSGGKFAVAR